MIDFVLYGTRDILKDELIAYIILFVLFRMPVYGTDLMHYKSGIFDCEHVSRLIDNILYHNNETEYLNKFEKVEFLGFHALTTVGVTDDYFIVKNSWGT